MIMEVVLHQDVTAAVVLLILTAVLSLLDNSGAAHAAA
jgi:hypothetical protein